MGDNKVNYDTFIEMLGELNQFIIEEYDSEYILDVRAIGGFSMIIHKRLGDIKGPRDMSRDIDSLRDFEMYDHSLVQSKSTATISNIRYMSRIHFANSQLLIILFHRSQIFLLFDSGFQYNKFFL